MSEPNEKEWARRLFGEPKTGESEPEESTRNHVPRESAVVDKPTPNADHELREFTRELFNPND